MQSIQYSLWCVIYIGFAAHGLTDKASDFESEDFGFESLCGRIFIIKSVFERFFLDKPLKTVQILRGF